MDFHSSSQIQLSRLNIMDGWQDLQQLLHKLGRRWGVRKGLGAKKENVMCETHSVLHSCVRLLCWCQYAFKSFMEIKPACHHRQCSRVSVEQPDNSEDGGWRKEDGVQAVVLTKLCGLQNGNNRRAAAIITAQHWKMCVKSIDTHTHQHTLATVKGAVWNRRKFRDFLAGS